jgi:hypothetical protein
MLIDFNTKLTIKPTNQEISNSVKLYPVRQNKLQELLVETGFCQFGYHGNFNLEPLSKNSLQLIVSCQKITS